MSNDAFFIGDVVRLKSGGPEMTIDELDDNGGVGCVWFEHAGDKWKGPKRKTFQPINLERVSRRGE
jgi:uncharacterized protein YodC (DUF2158 family)